MSCSNVSLNLSVSFAYCSLRPGCAPHSPAQVETKIMAEAAAIAEMERQALQMSDKRAQLEKQMSSRLQLEDTLVQESQKLSQKREAMKTKMRQEEEELQKLSDDAKRRVTQKIATEAAAIADMERQASELAAERAILAAQLAAQRSSIVPVAGEIMAIPTYPHDGSVIQMIQAPTTRTYETSKGGIQVQEGAFLGPIIAGGEDESKVDKTTKNVSNHHGGNRVQSERSSGLEERVIRFAPTTGLLHEVSSNEAQDHVRPTGVETAVAEENQPTQQEPAPEQLIGSSVCMHCRTDQRDMSPAHVAAAAGHIHCLQAIRLAYPEVMAKLDSAGRSPLFYACANAHTDAADLLVRECPQCCHLTDINKDTPLHAAALAGSAFCCRLLLQQDCVEVEAHNTMFMTPAHLGANNDVLEVLSQYGANLNSKVSLCKR